MPVPVYSTDAEYDDWHVVCMLLHRDIRQNPCHISPGLREGSGAARLGIALVVGVLYA
jgi:hypothetical protein